VDVVGHIKKLHGFMEELMTVLSSEGCATVDTFIDRS
jgi:hypothetical protein